jgi:hypothetical protein
VTCDSGHTRQTQLHHSTGGKLVCVCCYVYSIITLNRLVCDNPTVNRGCALSHLNTICSLRLCLQHHVFSYAVSTAPRVQLRCVYSTTCSVTLCLQHHVFSYAVSTISCDQFSSLPRGQLVALSARRVLHDVRGHGTPKVEATSNVRFLGFCTVQDILIPDVSEKPAAYIFRLN